MVGPPGPPPRRGRGTGAMPAAVLSTADAAPRAATCASSQLVVPWFFFSLAASLALSGHGVDAAAVGSAGNVESRILRREAAFSLDTDHTDDELDASEEGVNSFEVCDDRVTLETCHLLRQEPKGSPTSDTVSKSQLEHAFGECHRPFVDELLGEIGYQVSGDQLSCKQLCNSALYFFQEQEAGTFRIPAKSDHVCYLFQGAFICDEEVTPRHVAENMHEHLFYGQMQDEKFAGSLLAQGTDEELMANLTGRLASLVGSYSQPCKKSDLCPFKGIKAVVRLAQIFRFYPKEINANFIEAPEGSSITATEHVALWRSLAKAEAWSSLVLRGMVTNVPLAERAQYFGGQGSLTEQQLQEKLWATFSYVLKEFILGVHVVYPGPECANEESLQAYVLVSHPDQRGDSDTCIYKNALSCGGSGCGRSSQDKRYYMYFCPRTIDVDGEPVRTSVFVHEMTHHAGPLDVTYVQTKLKGLPQDEQLSNAPNYQWFAKAVVSAEAEEEDLGTLFDSAKGTVGSVKGRILDFFGSSSPPSARLGPLPALLASLPAAFGLLVLSSSG